MDKIILNPIQEYEDENYYNDLLSDTVKSSDEEKKRVDIFIDSLKKSMTLEQVKKRLSENNLREINPGDPLELIIWFCFSVNSRSAFKIDYDYFKKLIKKLTKGKFNTDGTIKDIKNQEADNTGKQEDPLTMKTLIEFVVNNKEDNARMEPRAETYIIVNRYLKTQGNKIIKTKKDFSDTIDGFIQFYDRYVDQLRFTRKSAQFIINKYVYLSFLAQMSSFTDYLREYSKKSIHHVLDELYDFNPDVLIIAGDLIVNDKEVVNIILPDCSKISNEYSNDCYSYETEENSPIFKRIKNVTVENSNNINDYLTKDDYYFCQEDNCEKQLSQTSVMNCAIIKIDNTISGIRYHLFGRKYNENLEFNNREKPVDFSFISSGKTILIKIPAGKYTIEQINGININSGENLFSVSTYVNNLPSYRDFVRSKLYDSNHLPVFIRRESKDGFSKMIYGKTEIDTKRSLSELLIGSAADFLMIYGSPIGDYMISEEFSSLFKNIKTLSNFNTLVDIFVPLNDSNDNVKKHEFLQKMLRDDNFYSSFLNFKIDLRRVYYYFFEYLFEADNMPDSIIKSPNVQLIYKKSNNKVAIDSHAIDKSEFMKKLIQGKINISRSSILFFLASAKQFMDINSWKNENRSLYDDPMSLNLSKEEVNGILGRLGYPLLETNLGQPGEIELDKLYSQVFDNKIDFYEFISVYRIYSKKNCSPVQLDFSEMAFIEKRDRLTGKK